MNKKLYTYKNSVFNQISFSFVAKIVVLLSKTCFLVIKSFYKLIKKMLIVGFVIHDWLVIITSLSVFLVF